MNGVSWIKLSVDLFSHPKIRKLFRLPYGDKAVLLWLFILTSAGQCNDDGRVYLAPDVPFTDDDFSIDLQCDSSIISSIINDFVRLKMISVDKSGIITVLNWSKYQSVDRLAEIREYNRLAKQKERERKKESKADVNDMSLTSQHRKEKRRKEKKNPQSPPSSNAVDYVNFVEGLTKGVE